MGNIVNLVKWQNLIAICQKSFRNIPSQNLQIFCIILLRAGIAAFFLGENGFALLINYCDLSQAGSWLTIQDTIHDYSRGTVFFRRYIL